MNWSVNLSASGIFPFCTVFPGKCTATTGTLDNNVSVPLLNSVLPANEAQIERIVDAAREAKHRVVGLIGLAFKDDTDDLRESPMVEIVRMLLLSGFDVRVFDPAVERSDMRGRNLQFARLGIPDLSQRFVSELDALVERCDTLICARKAAAQLPSAAFGDKIVIDLVGLDALKSLPGYRHVCW